MAPLSRWFILAPVLSSLACVASASAFCIASRSTAISAAILQVAFAGLIGWRVSEVFLHRENYRRLARLAREAVAKDGELCGAPIRVTLTRGKVAAFDEWIGWYRMFGFVAVLAPASAAQECLQLLQSERVQRRVETVLLHALQRNGWIDGTDRWTLLIAPKGGPSGFSQDHAQEAVSSKLPSAGSDDAGLRS